MSRFARAPGRRPCGCRRRAPRGRCSARLVLPRPGGPASRTWSSASPRALAASSAIPSCSLTRAWPTNSSSRRGRSVRSTSSSSPSRSAGARNCALMPPSSAPPHLLLDREARRRRARARRRRPTSRARRARRGPAAPRRRGGARRRPTPSFSFSSSTTRCAVFLPMPGIASKRAVSSRAIARRSSPAASRRRSRARPSARRPRRRAGARTASAPRRTRTRRAGARPRGRGGRSRPSSPPPTRALHAPASPRRGSRRRRRRRRGRRGPRGDGAAQPRDHVLSGEGSSPVTVRPAGGRLLPARSAVAALLEVREHGEHAAVLRLGRREAELPKMLATCFSTAPTVSTSASAMRRVRAALRHQLEHLALARGQRVERARRRAAGERAAPRPPGRARCRRRRRGAPRRRSRRRR